MPVSITANTSARYAQTSLTRQSDAVTQGTLRMSTGQRVLSAADDAAAMAIGTSLKIENSGLRAAILNSSSATSMLQIADGALGQISELVTRLQTLAVQASSGQYDDATRVLLDGEFQGLKQEIDRLANSTKFNEVAILTGTAKFDLATSATVPTDGITNIRLDPTIVTDDQSFRYTYDATSEQLTMTRVDTSPAVSQSVQLTPLLNGAVGIGVNLQGNQKLEVGFSQLGVTFTLDAEFDRTVAITNEVVTTTGGFSTVATPTFAAATTQVSLEGFANIAALGGTLYSSTTGILTLPLVSSGVAGTVTLGGAPGISYVVNGAVATASGAVSDDLVGTTATIDIYADVTGGGTMLLGHVTTGAIAATAAGSGSMAIDVGSGLIDATETDDIVPTHLTYKVGTGVRTGEDTIGVDVPAMTLKALLIEDVVVTSQGAANAAIDKLKSALTVLNQGRATVGAQQLRLEAVGRNLGVISDNNESARSGLIDVDVSLEITNITTNQSLMQASIAMLSRANQTPDILLELLRN